MNFSLFGFFFRKIGNGKIFNFLNINIIFFSAEFNFKFLFISIYSKIFSLLKRSFIFFGFLMIGNFKIAQRF